MDDIVCCYSKFNNKGNLCCDGSNTCSWPDKQWSVNAAKLWTSLAVLTPFLLSHHTTVVVDGCLYCTFSVSLSSSSSTRFVLDDWLESKFSDARVAQELLSTAQTLRSALDQLMTGRFQQTGDTIRMNVITTMCVPMNTISMCWMLSGHINPSHPVRAQGTTCPQANIYIYIIM